MKSLSNSWQSYLSHKGLFIIIYWKVKSMCLHLHVGNFDKMLSVSRYGVDIG